MKRLLVLAAASLLCLGLLGCAPEDDAALTVNGDDVLTVGALTEAARPDRRGERASSPPPTPGARAAPSSDLRSELRGRGALQPTSSTPCWPSSWPTEGVEVTDADVEEGTALLTDQLATPPEGVAPLTLEQVPADYRQTLIDLYSNFVALVGALDDDPQAAQDRLLEARLAAEVEVAQRYGRWDAEWATWCRPKAP